MNGLAEAALDYFVTFIFAGDEIKPDFAERTWQSFPQYVQNMNSEQRAALSEAARHRVSSLTETPEDHGYSPGAVPTDVLAFLELVASGQIYEQWSDASGPRLTFR